MRRPRFRLDWLRDQPSVARDRAAIGEYLAGQIVHVPTVYGVDALNAALRTLDALLAVPPQPEGDDSFVYAPNVRLQIDSDPRLNDNGLRRLRDLLIDCIAREHPEMARFVIRVADDPLTFEAFVDAALAAPPGRAVAEGMVASIQAIWRDLTPAARPWLIAQALEIDPPASELTDRTAKRLCMQHGLVVHSDPTDLRAPLHALKRCQTWVDADWRQIWNIARERLGPAVSALFDQVLAEERVGLGLQPPPADPPTEQRKAFDQLVALARGVSDPLVVVYGPSGSGRSAFGRALAHTLRDQMEAVWLSFERGPAEGWAEVAWAADLLPGGDWDGPPPWLDLLFEALGQAPRLYLIEEADTVPVPELPQWLPPSGLVVLLSTRRLRALEHPDVHRVRLRRWGREHQPVRWPVSALGWIGSLPRALLVDIDVSAVEDAERAGAVIPQPAGRLRLIDEQAGIEVPIDGQSQLIRRLLYGQPWPPRESDLLAAVALFGWKQDRHQDTWIQQAGLELLEWATQAAPAWLPSQAVCHALLDACDLLWDQHLSDREKDQLRLAEARLCNRVGQTQRGAHLLSEVTKADPRVWLEARFALGRVTAEVTPIATTLRQGDALAQACAAYLEGQYDEAARRFEPLIAEADLSQRAALRWIHWAVAARFQAERWAALAELTHTLLAQYPRAIHLRGINLHARQRLDESLPPEALDRLAHAEPIYALGINPDVADEWLERWIPLMQRRMDSGLTTSAHSDGIERVLWTIMQRRPGLRREMGVRLLKHLDAVPVTDAREALREQVIELLQTPVPPA